jgi:hypothetical protein
MRVSLTGLIVFALFCAALITTLNSGPDALHLGEAGATILIALGLFGFLTRHRSNGSADQPSASAKR